LNHGSAELRLGEHAGAHNLITKSRLSRIRDKSSRIDKWTTFFEVNRFHGPTWGEHVRKSGKGSPLPEDFQKETPQVREETLYRVAYQGYLAREQREVERLRHVEKIRIPLEINYLSIPGLRKESALKLAHIKPLTLGQASRMSGVNPTDISLLMIAIEAGREGESAA
jgi:tRNA uridine 5-carboxymethylaminomethyl modification enzyme